MDHNDGEVFLPPASSYIWEFKDCLAAALHFAFVK